jgi:hypothetical protein
MPPFNSRRLARNFRHPVHADSAHAIVFNTIPKQIAFTARSDVIRWGLEIEEELNWPRITLLFLLFIIAPTFFYTIYTSPKLSASSGLYLATIFGLEVAVGGACVLFLSEWQHMDFPELSNQNTGRIVCGASDVILRRALPCVRVGFALWHNTVQSALHLLSYSRADNYGRVQKAMICVSQRNLYKYIG